MNPPLAPRKQDKPPKGLFNRAFTIISFANQGVTLGALWTGTHSAKSRDHYIILLLIGYRLTEREFQAWHFGGMQNGDLYFSIRNTTKYSKKPDEKKLYGLEDIFRCGVR